MKINKKISSQLALFCYVWDPLTDFPVFPCAPTVLTFLLEGTLRKPHPILKLPWQSQVDTTMGSESDISRPMVLDLLKIRCNIRHENWKTKSRNNLTSNAWGNPSIRWSYGAKWFMNISEAGILCFLGSKFNLPFFPL